MAVLTVENITDMVNSTLRDLGRFKLTEIATDLQEHVALSRMMRKQNVKFMSGRGIQFNVMVVPGNNAKWVGLFNVDNLNQRDGTVTANIPWRHGQSGVTYDVRQVAMNAHDPHQVVDFVKEKRMMHLIDWAETCEAAFWGEPTASTDETTPFGIRYWFVYNATVGFNGGNNSNFSSGPAAINRTTYPRWKNYSGLYVTASDNDLVAKMRKAQWSCQFKSPIANKPIGDYNTGSQYGYYMTYDTLQALEDVAKANNDSLGMDVAPTDGRTRFFGNEMVAVPYLQENQATADPVVGINWGTFKTAALRGRWMVHSPVKLAAGQHNVLEAFLDCTLNFACFDCRRNFLLAKSTWH